MREVFRRNLISHNGDNRVVALLVAILFISASLAGFSPTVLLAATYYVQITGNDSTTRQNAMNQSTPRRTINAGKNCLTAPGDTLIVGDGTYVEGHIDISASGTLASPITIRAQNKWRATLSSISSCNPNISVGGSYITIDGLSLVIDPANVYCRPNSASGTGVRCWPGGTGCVVRNIKTDDPTGPNGKIRSHGVKTNQSNSIVENNELGAGMESLAGDNEIGRAHV